MKKTIRVLVEFTFEADTADFDDDTTAEEIVESWMEADSAAFFLDTPSEVKSAEFVPTP